MKVIFGIICGIAGDEILEYCEGNLLYTSIAIGFFLIGHIFYNLAMFNLW
jgi:hypothetical protein